MFRQFSRSSRLGVAVVTGLLVVSLFLSSALDAATYKGKRVNVWRKGISRPLAGTVVEEDSESIRLQRKLGSVRIKRADIQKIEVLPEPIVEYKSRKAKCKTASDWVKLAEWCTNLDIDLKLKFKECLRKALEIDPSHERANKLLGNVKVDGKWYPEDEGNKKLGKEKVDGKWFTPEEKEKYLLKKKLKKNPHIRRLLEQLKEREGRPWGSVEPIVTENYEVKCNSTPEVARRYSQLLEDLYESYTEMFDDTDYPRFFEEKGVVYIFRNHAEFMEYRLMGPGIGGYYHQFDRAVRAYHGSFGVTGSTEMVLAHEVTHQFQGQIIEHMRSVPTWLIEGMAVYYGDGTNITNSGVELHVIPRDRLATLKRAIRTKRYRSLRNLLVTPQRMFGPFYDHGWGVIFWCLQGSNYDQKDGTEVWNRYLDHVCHELPSVQEVGNYAKHLKRESEKFVEILLEETGYESVKLWEDDYKKFILDLPLEPLGSWKGRTWDGLKKVGLKLNFPKDRSLKIVDQDGLRADRREAAAMQIGKDLRMWVVVDPNYREQYGKEFSLKTVKYYIDGYFEKVSYKRGGHKPKVEMLYGDLDDFPIVTSTFRGRLKERRESGMVGGGGFKKMRKKGDDEPKKAKSKSKDLEPGKRYTVTISFLATQDKMYLIFLAGTKKTHPRIHSQFKKVLQSVKIEL